MCFITHTNTYINTRIHKKKHTYPPPVQDKTRDGFKHGRGFRIATHCFALEPVQLLVSTLKERFDIDCTIHIQQGKPMISIRVSSMERFRSLVHPFFHTSMLYKL